MQTRRNFIGNVATGLAGTLATGTLAPGKAFGASDRIRVGIVGVGDRGTQLAREAAACPNTELVAFADGSGMVSLAVNSGDAAQRLGLPPGAHVSVSPAS